jgi:tetratricopeptide (TPR) repeat protein
LDGAGCRSLAVLAATALALCLNGTAALADKKPVDWDKKLAKGYNELSIGNVNEAIDWFSGKVKSYPDSAACHTGLGLALKKKGKLGEAKAEFRKATDLDNSFGDAFYELGAMLESDKEYQAAADAFERYLVLKPDSNRKAAVADRIRFCRDKVQ